MGSTERHPAQAVAGRAGAIGASRTGSAQAAARADVTPACNSPASKTRDPAIAAYSARSLLLTLVQRVLARPPKPPALDGLPKAPG